MNPPLPAPTPPAPPPPPDLAVEPDAIRYDANGLPLGLPIPPDFLAICAGIKSRVARESIQPAA